MSREERTAAELVAAEWQDILALGADMVDPVVPRTAYANPRLRQLWPIVSHGTLAFSRCIHSPWSNDIGTAYRQVGGGYMVRRGAGKGALGVTETVQEAMDLIAENLPPGTGSAIDGTANDL